MWSKDCHNKVNMPTFKCTSLKSHTEKGFSLMGNSNEQMEEA